MKNYKKFFQISLLAVVSIVIFTGCTPIFPREEKNASVLDKSQENVQESNIAWSTFKSDEVGIQFEFPISENEVQYRYNECSQGQGCEGKTYQWRHYTKYWDTGRNTSMDYEYDFAGGPSVDFSPDGPRWITQYFRVEVEERKYFEKYKNFGGPEIKFEIHPLKVIQTHFGTSAFIFDPGEDILGLKAIKFQQDRKDLAAIVNFPANYHPDFHNIVFYFFEEHNLKNIERVINSIALLKN